eukprot:6455769-Amphidinium_carterae.2
MGFDIHEGHAEKLFEEYLRPALVGWTTTSLQQILDADREPKRGIQALERRGCKTLWARTLKQVSVSAMSTWVSCCRCDLSPGYVRTSSRDAAGGKRRLQRENANFCEQIKRSRHDSSEPKRKPASTPKGKSKQAAAPGFVT